MYRAPMTGCKDPKYDKSLGFLFSASHQLLGVESLYVPNQ